MKRTSETVVFFGSGPVAAKCLTLLSEAFSIEAVVTKPSTKQEMHDASPQARQYVVASKSELDALVASKPFNSRLGVLIDFGIIVSQDVIDYFPLGIINSHFSLLPEWRGADPITFSILSGQEKTGVTLMLLVEAMDEGPVLAFGEQQIKPNATTPILTEQLIVLSDSLLKGSLNKYISGEIKTASQNTVSKIHGRTVSYSRKLTKEDGIIDWAKPAVQIEREIRAFTGWPRSKTTLGGKTVVVTEAHTTAVEGRPGHAFTTENKEPAVHCGQGSLVIDRLIPAGKKEMTGQAFLAGHKL